MKTKNNLLAVLIFLLMLLVCSPLYTPPANAVVADNEITLHIGEDTHWPQVTTTPWLEQVADKQSLSAADKQISYVVRDIPPSFVDADGAPIMLSQIVLTENAQVRDVLINYLHDYSINAVVAPDINCHLNINMHNVRFWDAFRHIVKACNLGYRAQNNILQIGTLADLNDQKSKVELVTSGPHFLHYLTAAEAQAYIRGESFSDNQDGNVDSVGHQGWGGYSDDNNSSSSSSSSSTDSSSGLLSSSDDVNGDPVVIANEATNSITIRDLPENVDRIVRLLKELDQPAQQIRIQAWVMETSDSIARQIGMRWGLSFNAGNETKVVSSSPNVQLADQSGVSLYNSVASTAIKAFVAPTETNQAGAPAESKLYALGTGYQGNHGNITAEMQALETSGKVKIISRPELVLRNNMAGSISTGKVLNVQFSTNDRVEVKEIKALLRLTVRPRITTSGGVYLKVQVCDDYVDHVNSVGTIPEIFKKEINTQLMVGNGETVVLGGLRKDEQRNSDAGVPFLKDIPLLGRLFKYGNNAKDYDELVIVLRPTIVTQEAFHPTNLVVE